MVNVTAFGKLERLILSPMVCVFWMLGAGVGLSLGDVGDGKRRTE